MTGNDGQQQPPTPFAKMIAEAKAGNINVRMSLEDFVYADRDFQTLIDNIQRVQDIMDGVSRNEHWGLGESYRSDDGKELISGQKVVEWYRTKSRGQDDATDNSFYAVMESHRQAALGIQETYREMRKRITDADAEAAAQYQHLEETLPQRPTVKPPEFHAVNLPPQKK